MSFSRAIFCSSIALLLAVSACGETASKQDGQAGAGSTSATAGNGAGGTTSASTAGSAGQAGDMSGTSGNGAGNTGGSSSTGASGNSGAGGTSPASEVLLFAQFEEAETGTYSRDDVLRDFGIAAPWDNGLSEGRASIQEEAMNHFLRVTYPANQFGPKDGGVQFKMTFDKIYMVLDFEYRVRFHSDFDFVKGGKLPGLTGGTGPTGCKPDTQGFSARNMWRAGGKLVQYVYYPDQPNSCGDDIAYNTTDGAFSFTLGQWHHVQHHIEMNQAGVADGILRTWIDGKLAIDESTRIWRKTGESYGIDALYFSTFFGGGDASWAPASEQIADFDDLRVFVAP